MYRINQPLLLKRAAGLARSQNCHCDSCPQSDPSLDNESRKLYGPLHAKVIAVSKAASETLLSTQGKSINIIQHITFCTFVVTTWKANKCAHPRKQTITRLGSACFQAGRNMMFTCSEIR